jgi:serralysin
MDKNTRACVDRIVQSEALRPPQYSSEAMRRLEEQRQRGGNLEIFTLAAKIWPKRTLHVLFLEGDPQIQKKVQYYASDWTNYARLKLEFVSDKSPADIRISFKVGEGSWSYIGTDALSIEDPKEPTMNYGWLSPTTPDEEYSRVVKHEFGHALGCPHEHQHPQGGIKWNEQAVIRDLSGPPNFWDERTIRHNLFGTYDHSISIYSEFDPKSIMLYSIPAEWTIDRKPVGDRNNDLSELDKKYMKEYFYP